MSRGASTGAGRRAPAPWYREPWAWLVFGVPAAAVIAGAAMLFVSIRSYDGVVVDDYYKRGLAIDRTLARDERAAALGLGATLSVREDANGGLAIEVELGANEGFAAPAEVLLGLLHATRAGLDRQVRLTRVRERSYSGRAAIFPPGPWQAEISAHDWRLTARLRAPLDAPLRFEARYGRDAGSA